MRRVIIIGLVLLAATAAFGQDTEPITYIWAAPTSGADVAHYVIQHSVNGGPFVSVGISELATFTLMATVGDSHQIRVAGVDASERQGPFSEASDSFLLLGPPGAPGKPTVVEL